MSDEDDFDWVPPSESELKVIAARRERSDKISQLMSGYLLKGYKMLATVCPECNTIQLQGKQGQVYCVACQEVDNTESAKDNPAINEGAARRQISEGNSSNAPCRAAPPSRPPVAQVSLVSPPTSEASPTSSCNPEVAVTVAVLWEKIRRARSQLASLRREEEAAALDLDLVRLIKESAEAIAALQKLK